MKSYLVLMTKTGSARVMIRLRMWRVLPTIRDIQPRRSNLSSHIAVMIGTLESRQGKKLIHDKPNLVDEVNYITFFTVTKKILKSGNLDLLVWGLKGLTQNHEDCGVLVVTTLWFSEHDENPFLRVDQNPISERRERNNFRILEIFKLRIRNVRSDASRTNCNRGFSNVVRFVLVCLSFKITMH